MPQVWGLFTCLQVKGTPPGRPASQSSTSAREKPSLSALLSRPGVSLERWAERRQFPTTGQSATRKCLKGTWCCGWTTQREAEPRSMSLTQGWTFKQIKVETESANNSFKTAWVTFPSRIMVGVSFQHSLETPRLWSNKFKFPNPFPLYPHLNVAAPFKTCCHFLFACPELVL